ncbi:MATE family efflux transporter [Granulicella sp. dw_53]|uniref:MATE family efflux transporter n=1 Tax=Granulicella sp. dw_53 TaxID=2719792 RepID=UPI002107C0D0|nr:MATE family efflux transporter [Granulicella sp. dw_53]
MLHLALPLVLAEIGWMVMGIVDTIMVGHLPNSAVALGAAALGQVMYHTLAFGIGGVLLGLDTVLSQAFGAKRIDDANRSLQHGLVLGAVLTVILMGIVALMPIGFSRLHTDPQILAGSVPFLNALNWGTPALILWLVLRRYLQAFNHVRAIAFTLISANIINVAFNWFLIYGHQWGPIHIPAYGVVGSGWSTMLSRCYQAIVMLAAIFYYDRRHSYGLFKTKWRWEPARLRELLSLGGPIGAQIFVEIAIFGAVTAIISTFGALPLAGHQIALDCASFTFMVPMGISTATSVRVGQAIGRGDAAGAKAAGWTGILLSSIFMLTASCVFIAIPSTIARGFTPSPQVIAAAVPLMFIVAIFQLFDGLQMTATGALRGAGNTSIGFYVHLCAYWVVGLPVGLYFGMRHHLGAAGLWSGLCLGLILAGIALTSIWHRTTAQLETIIASHKARPSLANPAPIPN